jgi:hypothetical protein
VYTLKEIRMFDEKKYHKEYYAKNKKKILARQKEMQAERYPQKKKQLEEYYKTKNGRIIRFLAGAKKRATAKGLEFDLDLEFLRSIAPNKCPVFGFELDWNGWGTAEGKAKENSPSLDKIDPNRGYVKGNVMWLSWKANRLKSNVSHEDLLILANWLKDFEKENTNDRKQTNSTTSTTTEHTD